jgi:hypothetical protein
VTFLFPTFLLSLFYSFLTKFPLIPSFSSDKDGARSFST